MNPDRLKSAILEAFKQEENKAERSKQEVTCELMTHPGHMTSVEYGGFCWGTDEFGASTDRKHEIDVLGSREMKEFYQQENIQLVSHSVL